jgi:hypothetical protein
MDRTTARGVLVAASVAVLLLVPREAVTGTYGSYTLVRKGYTVSCPINVGSMSPHSEEAVRYAEKEKRAEAAVLPALAVYDRYFERAASGRHAYSDWLGALDAARGSALQEDYKFRVPGPETPPSPPPEGRRVPLMATQSLADCDVYLHMKKTATGLERGRALVGFVLAEIALGDEKNLLLPRRRDSWSARQSLDWASRADFYSGQAWAIGQVLFSIAKRAPELSAAAEDRSAPDEVRLLARMIEMGLKRGAPSEEDWALVKSGSSRLDARTLWTWPLFFGPSAARADSVARLKAAAPVQDETFIKSFLEGPPN